MKLRKMDVIFLMITAAMAILLIINHFMNGALFPEFIICFGIWSFSLLWYFILNVLCLSCKEKINKSKIMISIIFILVSSCMYVYINYAADTVKIWDYACYYRFSLNMKELFHNGMISAFKHVMNTIYHDEYNLFLLLFTIFPYELTVKTHQDFINAYYIVYMIPTMIIWMSAGNRILKKCGRSEDISYAIVCGVVAAFPLLHAAATKGMPDAGGLLFAGLIILLCMDYDFERFDGKRIVFLGIASICLFIFRRWYTFWLIGFYISYFGYCMAGSIMSKNHEKTSRILKNILLFCICMVCILGITLFPMIRRILSFNFGEKYSAWNQGGMIYEMISQYRRLGLLILILIISGYLCGIRNKRTRKIAVISIFTGFITFVLFTRIQNMGLHQSLLLVPTYIIGIFLLVSEVKNNLLKKCINCMVLIVLLLNGVGSLCENRLVYANGWFGNVTLKPEVRDDMQLISEINDFITKQCSEEKTIYMVLGSAAYNPEVFKNVFLPDKSRDSVILSEHSVDLTHGFPTEFFDAKYVLTSNPVQQGGYSSEQMVISELDKAMHNGSIVSGKFKIVTTIRNDDIEFYIYERISEVDNLELDYFKSVFDVYYDRYPELYRDRIEAYRT